MQKTTEQLLARLKAMADPVRLRIVALCTHGECSVSELTRVLALSQPRVSQHLKQLCAANLLERFRDGQFAYYRVPLRGDNAQARRRVLALVPADEPAFARDMERLRELRGIAVTAPVPTADDADARRLHRALVALTLAAPLGDLLDIGSGQGRVLKLLASRSRRAVGVDIDADARQFARAELLLAGAENVSLRKGNMYALPFETGEFDTVILDDTLASADEPILAICEARRLLKPGGRLILLASANVAGTARLEERFSAWCRAAELRLAVPQRIPRKETRWLLGVATPADAGAAAA